MSLGLTEDEVDSLTPHLLHKVLGAFEHLLGAGRDVGSNQQLVQLLCRELDGHAQGGHEESEAPGSPISVAWSVLCC